MHLVCKKNVLRLIYDPCTISEHFRMVIAFFHLVNEYQKFVQKENKKEKYKNMSGKDRLIIIANKWKKLHIFKK